MNGIESINVERQRQIDEENWTSENDDLYTSSELEKASACYILHNLMPEMSNRLRQDTGDVLRGLWPFHVNWFKPKTRREDLVRAGALIAAEIDRLDRLYEAKFPKEADQ